MGEPEAKKWYLSQIIVQGDLDLKLPILVDIEPTVTLFYYSHGTLVINTQTQSFSLFIGAEIIYHVFYLTGIRRFVKETVQKGLNISQVDIVGNLQIINAHFYGCFSLNFIYIVQNLIPFLAIDCEFEITFKYYQQEDKTLECSLDKLQNVSFLKSISQLYVLVKDKSVEEKTIIIKFMRAKQPNQTHCTLITPCLSPTLFVILEIVEHFSKSLQHQQ